jgi:hypothetical protein
MLEQRRMEMNSISSFEQEERGKHFAKRDGSHRVLMRR